jgi:hypothetical protein
MHRIHLRGPWQLEPADGSPPVTIRIPLEPDALAHLHGPARLIRRFNRPTNLSPNERVFVVLEGWETAARVSVNGVELGETLDATDALRVHNVLTVDVDEFGPRMGSVSLTIEVAQQPKASGGREPPDSSDARRA